jgi:hypothetical protein
LIFLTLFWVSGNSQTPVTILPGQSKTFSHTVFNSEATSYSITVTKPIFITFTDLGVTRIGSFLRVTFKLYVSLSAPGGTHTVNIRYQFNQGFPSLVIYTYNVYTGPLVAIGDENLDIPTDFSLHQNFPNPFNPTTTITYELPKAVDVTLTIFNSLGRKVRTLESKQQAAGSYTVEWNGTDDSGNAVTSGIYFYQLKAGSFVEVKKMTLMK